MCKQSRSIVQTADFDNSIYDLEVGKRRGKEKEECGEQEGIMESEIRVWE